MRATAFGLSFFFRILYPVLCVAALILAPGAVWGAEPLGVIGGVSNAMAVSGNYAYVGEGLYLKVIDISDETRPKGAGALKLPHPLKLIAVSGSYGYLYCGNGPVALPQESEFVVVDLTNPRSPKLVSSQWFNAITDLQTQGGWAYMAHGGKVEVYSLANPRQPQLASTFPAPDNTVRHYKFALAGTRAYATGAPQSRHDLSYLVYDVSNPRDVRYLGAAQSLWNDPESESEVYAIGADNKRIYTVVQSYLRIHDAANSAKPALLSETFIEDGFYECAIAPRGDRVFVLTGDNLLIFNVSNPRQPTLAGKMARGSVRAIAAPEERANTVFINERYSGLKIMDYTTPAAPRLKGFAPSSGFGPMAVDAPYAFVGNYSGGIHVINASDPSSLSVAAVIQTPSSPWALEKRGDLLYVAGDKDLEVWDGSRPTSATMLGSLAKIKDTQGAIVNPRFCRIKSHDGMLYAVGLGITEDYANTTGRDFLTIVDAHDPTSPKQLAYMSIPSAAFLGSVDLLAGAALSGAPHDYLYIQMGGAIQIFDVTNTRKPIKAATFQPGEGVLSFALFQQRGINYMMTMADVDYQYRMLIYSLADPLHPQCISSQTIYIGQSLSPYPIVISGEYAVIASPYRVVLLSIANLKNLVELDRAPMSVDSILSGVNVGLHGSTLYALDSSWGLMTYRLKSILPENATIVSDTFPRRMYAGQFISGAVTARNSGQSTWNQGNPALPAARGGIAMIGAVSHCEPLNENVAPGQEHAFAALLTAPEKPGEYALTLQIARPQSSSTPLSFFGEPYMIRVTVTPRPSSAQGWMEYR